MGRGVALAWFVGMGIIGWRDVAVNHRPPMPGQLAGASGLFALLALLAQYEPASLVAGLIAWGVDVAALLNVLPAGLGGQPAAQPAGSRVTVTAAARKAAPGGSTA